MINFTMGRSIILFFLVYRKFLLVEVNRCIYITQTEPFFLIIPMLVRTKYRSWNFQLCGVGDWHWNLVDPCWEDDQLFVSLEEISLCVQSATICWFA